MTARYCSRLAISPCWVIVTLSKYKANCRSWRIIWLQSFRTFKSFLWELRGARPGQPPCWCRARVWNINRYRYLDKYEEARCWAVCRDDWCQAACLWSRTPGRRGKVAHYHRQYPHTLHLLSSKYRYIIYNHLLISTARQYHILEWKCWNALEAKMKKYWWLMVLMYFKTHFFPFIPGGSLAACHSSVAVNLLQLNVLLPGQIANNS